MDMTSRSPRGTIEENGMSGKNVLMANVDKCRYYLSLSSDI